MILLNFFYDNQIIFSCKVPKKLEPNTKELELHILGRSFIATPFQCVSDHDESQDVAWENIDLKLGFLGARPDLQKIKDDIFAQGWELVYWCDPSKELEIVSLMIKDHNTDLLLISPNKHLITYFGKQRSLSLVLLCSIVVGVLGLFSFDSLAELLIAPAVGAGFGLSIVGMKVWAVGRFAQKFNCFAVSGTEIF